MPAEIILASGSVHRAKILSDAGLAFSQQAPDLDERALEAPLLEADLPPDDVAAVLAEAKAVAVSEQAPGALVIGCDQTLSLGSELLHKVEDMEAARRRLLQLPGKTHHLNSAIVLARGGGAIWRHVAVCRMTMRDLDPGFVGRHLAEAGEGVLSSVGAYQVEGIGVQLFEKIEGDLFSIVGLPLLQLLAELRRLGAIDA